MNSNAAALVGWATRAFTPVFDGLWARKRRTASQHARCSAVPTVGGAMVGTALRHAGGDTERSPAPLPTLRSHGAARKSGGHKGRRYVAPNRCAASGERDVVVLERDRADALAGRREERVEHRRRRHEDGRLADAAPEAAGRHDARLDFG